MLEADPTISGSDHDDREPVEESFRWKTEHDRRLLVHCFAYFEVGEYYTYKRSRAKLLFTMADPLILIAIREAYESLRKPLQKFLDHSAAGFAHGSLPLPPRETDDNDAPVDLSDSEKEAILSGMSQGAKHGIMKALGEA